MKADLHPLYSSGSVKNQIPSKIVTPNAGQARLLTKVGIPKSLLPANHSY